MRSRQANVSTPVEINAPDPLRQAALHPCPQRILGFFAQTPEKVYFGNIPPTYLEATFRK